MYQVPVTREFLESRTSSEILEWLSRDKQLLSFLSGIKPNSADQTGASKQEKTKCDLILKRPDVYTYDVHIRFRAEPTAPTEPAEPAETAAKVAAAEREAAVPVVEAQDAQVHSETETRAQIANKDAL